VFVLYIEEVLVLYIEEADIERIMRSLDAAGSELGSRKVMRAEAVCTA
jgi:hypothetical protein